jgi:RNA polymerase sigma-70 factor (ECF subfamily)
MPSRDRDQALDPGGTNVARHDDKPDALPQDLRTDWHRYVDFLVPLRPVLYGYCHRLTGTVWDAEDLVQDTLVRAFARWGVTRPGIRNPRAYLLRTATNVWIDLQRRRKTESRAPEVDPAATPATNASPALSSHVRDASGRLLQRLSPQERAALVLKEVFDMKLDEIAEVLATTTGAVKAALHRGRGRLAEPEGGVASRRPAAAAEVIDRFVERFHAEDLKGLIDLMLGSGSFENVGNSFHIGLDPEQGTPDPLRAVVYGHGEWPKGLQFEGTQRRAERIAYDGEWIAAFFISRDGREALTNVMRFDELDGRIARVRSYGFCPDTIRAIADSLGVPAWTGIYRAPTPAPGEEWPG